MTHGNISWLRLGAGHYASGDGAWSVRSWRKNEWWLFASGRLQGRWRQQGGLRVYRPFRTLWEARDAAERFHVTWPAPARVDRPEGPQVSRPASDSRRVRAVDMDTAHLMHSSGLTRMPACARSTSAGGTQQTRHELYDSGSAPCQLS